MWPSSNKNRSLTGSNRGLSVSFSFRKKSKKNGPKLQRMLSENPNLQAKRRKEVEEDGDGQRSALGSQMLGSKMLGSDSKLVGPACHSSPDVRSFPTVEPFPGFPLSPKGNHDT